MLSERADLFEFAGDTIELTEAAAGVAGADCTVGA